MSREHDQSRIKTRDTYQGMLLCTCVVRVCCARVLCACVVRVCCARVVTCVVHCACVLGVVCVCFCVWVVSKCSNYTSDVITCVTYVTSPGCM